jgi:hypothetical protein
MKMSGQLHDSVALPPGKEPPVSPRVGLDAVVKRKDLIIAFAGN